MTSDESTDWLDKMNLFDQAYMIYAGALAIGLVVMVALKELGEEPDL